MNNGIQNMPKERLRVKLTPEEKSLYSSYFDMVDTSMSGKIEGQSVITFLKKSNLSKEILKNIYVLSAQTNLKYLEREEFYLSLRLVALAQNNMECSAEAVRLNYPIPPLPKFNLKNNNSSSNISSSINTQQSVNFNYSSMNNNNNFNSNYTSNLNTNNNNENNNNYLDQELQNFKITNEIPSVIVQNLRNYHIFNNGVEALGLNMGSKNILQEVKNMNEDAENENKFLNKELTETMELFNSFNNDVNRFENMLNDINNKIQSGQREIIEFRRKTNMEKDNMAKIQLNNNNTDLF